jgi:hypothetical protein
MDQLRDLPHAELLRLAAESTVLRDHLRAELELVCGFANDFHNEASRGWANAIEAPRRMAREGGNATAELSRKNKAKVFAWCDENLPQYKGRIQAAIDRIRSERVVACAETTVRDYITEYRKRRKLAGSAKIQ